jgi:hypothetical protein
VTEVRLAAILAGMIVVFTLDRGLNAAWYVYLPSGLVVYCLVHYAGWAVKDNQRFKREMSATIERAKRGE